MLQTINKTVYRCGCEWKDCQHQWEADATDDKGKKIPPPARCARCKRYTWQDGVYRDNGKPQTRQKRAVKMPKPRKVRSYEE